MGFLDNSGDIILDAVLTDAGRRRLARGDGTFSIAKFALGDDEINYRLYDPAHASGSAYYDLEILQTPVLEAITSPGAQLHSKLVTLDRNDFLYLPVLELFEVTGTSKRDSTTNAFLVAVNKTTEDNTSINAIDGVMFGETMSNTLETIVRVDQGVDANGNLAIAALTGDLLEEQYEIQIDNRLGSIFTINGTERAASFVDTDNIATYFVSLATASDMVTTITDTSAGGSSINGRRGTRLEFKIRASLDINGSDTLFTRLGGTSTVGGVAVKHIDSTVRVTGVSTGYSIDIPVRFIKI
tara:strand:+ start:193 stop:1086 length:894 start_codon:yes stop_codon:yes gene_type:complete